MLSISNNYQSMSFATLRDTSLATALERLSSGLRINSAADDSAGLQISNRLASSKNAHNQINRNLNDGISYAQIAEGGLQESAALLQRMRQLSIQSQNGINSDSDRFALDKEFQQLKLALNAIAYNTEAFNSLPLVGDEDLLSDNVPSLSDTFSQGVEQSMTSGLRSIAYIPAGSSNVQIDLNDNGANDDIQVFTTDGKHLVGTPLTNATWVSKGITSATDLFDNFFLVENGYSSDASYDDSDLLTVGSATINGNSFTFTGDQQPSSTLESLTIGTTTQPLIISVIGNGSFRVTADWDSLGDENQGNSYSLGPVNITASNNTVTGTQYIELQKTPATLEALNIADTNIITTEAAEEAISRLDDALNNVSESRAFYGAKMNQMTSAYKVNAEMSVNVEASYSRIVDADFAKETARLTQSQIVEQASVSVLSQANANNEQVLGLLDSTFEQATQGVE
ncbi:flagellin [Alteromonas stellipolaris]|uniref:flagellin N-terminal helical domain-containing protein n=1 Tax=Alteromonas stellipolaris TaxID=233316 RepID=UPI002117506E|nr:flagellin [Alteromonas stellipolaris]MCQ8850423.1 flagellin [Alteromonas stellipolaris]